MTYFKTMIRLLEFDSNRVTCLNIKQLQYYCIVNVLTLGLAYGAAASFFSRTVLVEKGLDAAAYNAVKIIVAGIPAAFLMHAGAALFVWVFLSAIGGKSNFIRTYFYMGVAAVSLWPAAPFVAALQTGSRGPIITGLAVCFSVFGFTVTVRMIKHAFQLSRARMFIAMSVTVLYITCFLYLWV